MIQSTLSCKKKKQQLSVMQIYWHENRCPPHGLSYDVHQPLTVVLTRVKLKVDNSEKVKACAVLVVVQDQVVRKSN